MADIIRQHGKDFIESKRFWRSWQQTENAARDTVLSSIRRHLVKLMWISRAQHEARCCRLIKHFNQL